jgi:hypothetical protein
MLFFYFVTLLGKWFLEGYVLSLWNDIVNPVLLLAFSVGIIVIPSLLGRFVFCKTKIVIAQKILAWIPIVLWEIFSVFYTISFL